jgi:hypothetical protein
LDLSLNKLNNTPNLFLAFGAIEGVLPLTKTDIMKAMLAVETGEVDKTFALNLYRIVVYVSAFDDLPPAQLFLTTIALCFILFLHIVPFVNRHIRLLF